MRQRGFTLYEILVTMVIAFAALALVMSLFIVGRRTGEAAYSNYLVNRDTENGIAWLRRDLQNSSLASIRTFPGPSGTNEAPGLSMCTCVPADKPTTVLINEFGAPRWSSNVYYTLEPEGADTGSLVRWTTAVPTNQLLPLPSGVMPSAQSDKTNRRELLHGVLLPNKNIFEGGTPGATDDRGGFRAQFVRRAGGEAGAESLSDRNPSEVTLSPDGDNIADNTRLVEVELRMLHKSTTGKPSVYAIKFRVCPRY